MNWRERGVGIARIIFGLVWVVAATLQWQPQFQNTFVAQVAAAKDGQPATIMGWVSFWANLVSVNPLLFARILATTESAIAIFLILGLFSNLTLSWVSSYRWGSGPFLKALEGHTFQGSIQM